MKQKIALSLGCCIFLLLATVTPGQSCVGRILTLSVNDSIEQKLIGQLLATYITERTGTTVNLTSAQDTAAGEQQIKENKADIILDYLNVGLTNLAGAKKSGQDQEAYGLVKQYYIETFDMVWLKPLGYKGPLLNSANSGELSLAIPVTTREVLNRFPVLDRVINKLGGRIDEQTLQRLVQAAEQDEIAAVVKNFLKAQNLI